MRFASLTWFAGVVLAGALIVCAVGVLDDIRELDWLTKLAGQMLAAGVMAFKGVQLLSLPLFFVLVGFVTFPIGIFVIGVWVIYRVARGWLKLKDGQPV